MPSIIKAFGYKIYFWSNENDPTEPIHVHVSKVPQEHATKIWILSNGDVELENNNSHIPDNDLRKILKTVEEFSDDIKDEWRKYFHTASYIDENKDIDR